MKKFGLCCITLSMVLLAAVPTLAVLHASLENPSNVQAVSGITTLSGWAFSTLPDTPVRVKLRIDGITLDPRLPCCSPRLDVVNVFGAGTPLDSGFGLLFNYGLLSPGPHTIGVEVRAEGETTQFIDHSVRVVKPGNAEFLSTFTLPPTASCAVEGNEVVITGAQVTPQGGATTTTDLRAQFQTNIQSLVITEASGVPTPTVFTAHLDGSQETPPVKTSASGTGSLTLNPGDNTISCSITASGIIGSSVAHLRLAPAGVAGPIIVPLSGGPTLWACPSSPAAVLTAEQVSVLQEGRLYFDVHSDDDPERKIRGQIVAPGA
jgi:hypothetical protein